MANTAADLLNVLDNYIGVSGRPNVFTRDYASRHGDAFLRAAWCDMFITFGSRKSGAKAALPKGDRAYTVWHADDFAGIRRWYSGTKANVIKHAVPGSIAFMDWNGSDSRGAIDHVTYVKKNLGDGRIVTVEGNTSDRVAYRVRSYTVIAGFGNPAYAVTPVKPIGNTWPYKSTTLMRKGWENSAGVRKVQSAIDALGFRPRLVVDGDFGIKTETGVKWYQKREHIQVDGIVGPVTWRHLFQG